MTAKHPMIPFPVIVRAADGDIEAVNQIVRHYSGFIASRSMRPISSLICAFINEIYFTYFQAFQFCCHNASSFRFYLSKKRPFGRLLITFI